MNNCNDTIPVFVFLTVAVIAGYSGETTAPEERPSTLIDSDINANRTLSNICVAENSADYTVSGFIHVTDAVVTVEAGLRIVFEQDAALRVNDGAALYARCEFSQADTEGTVYMMGAEPTPGFWCGILFRSEDLTSELNFVEISNSSREAFGGVAIERANIAVDVDGNLTLPNSIISDSNGWGVWLNDDERVIFNEEGNTYQNNFSGNVNINA